MTATVVAVRLDVGADVETASALPENGRQLRVVNAKAVSHLAKKSGRLLGSGRAVLIGVVLTSLVGVMAGMRSMAMSDVGMVCRGFVFSGVVMLGGFTMVMSGLRVMFRSVSVVFRSLVLHLFFPCCNST